MNIVITGCAGYIGSVLTAHLLQHGHTVTGIDNLRYGGEGIIGLLHHPRFKLVRGDVRDEELLARTFYRKEAVVHLAALVGDRACDGDQDEAWGVNAQGTLCVTNAALASGIKRLLLASTASCYGANADGVYSDEFAPLNPLSLYAETKIAAEGIVIEGASSIGTVLRFATVFGLSPRMRFDLILNQFALEAVSKGRLLVYEPQAWRSHVHVYDLARALRFLLGTDEPIAGQTINVGGYNARKQHLVNGLQDLCDFEVDVRQTGNDQRDYQVDFGRIASLGWEPRLMLEVGLSEVARTLWEGWLLEPSSLRYVNW